MTMAKEIIHIPDIEKFLRRIKVSGECWEWTGEVDVYGYGMMSFEVENVWRKYRAHRLSYDVFKGLKGGKMVVDHVCRNRRCVNPDHLREVDPSVNATENSTSTSAINKAKTHCSHGHEYDDKNTTWYRNKRYCKACDRRKSAIKRAKQVEAVK